jgi:hypothetical protein
MMAVAHHAYFLPWLGYFSKLEFADTLIVLDSVAFRRDHVKRVRIFDNRYEVAWLTVPVGNHRNEACNTIAMPSDHRYIENMLKLLFYSYKHASAFDIEYPAVSSLLQEALQTSRFIVEANLRITHMLRSHMGLAPIRTALISELSAASDRTERIIDGCRALGADELLIGDGHMQSVHDLGRIRTSGITIYQQHFARDHPVYPQLHTAHRQSPFVGGLSIIDALLNVGAQNVVDLIRQKRLAPQLVPG